MSYQRKRQAQVKTDKFIGVFTFPFTSSLNKHTNVYTSTHLHGIINDIYTHTMHRKHNIDNNIRATQPSIEHAYVIMISLLCQYKTQPVKVEMLIWILRAAYSTIYTQ